MGKLADPMQSSIDAYQARENLNLTKKQARIAEHQGTTAKAEADFWNKLNKEGDMDFWAKAAMALKSIF